MSERYTRLFALPENLYAKGSPVVLAAGALLKDNQTGGVLAQLKFRSISPKDIQAVKVCLNLFDTSGSPLGEPVIFDYLDLCARRDTEFGQKTPIPLPESKARSYTACVTEVVFSDKTTWTSDGAPWEPLPEPKPLESVFQDAELVKQYKIAAGSNSTCYPMQEKDLWFCACGAVNRVGETCHRCQRTLESIRDVDREQLVRDKDARLAEEQRRAAAEAEAAKKKYTRIGIISAAVLVVVMVAAMLLVKERRAEIWDTLAVRDTISAGAHHTVGLQSDGTVVATEDPFGMGMCDVSDWKDTVAISAGEWLTVGLQSDGTVVAVGMNGDGQCDVSGWTGIVAISAGWYHTVGLKSDGTVVAAGSNDWYGKEDYEDGQCDVSGWKNIVAISAGAYHTVGLKSDGTVVAVGMNGDGQCDVSGWSDIVAISAGDAHTVGLKSDGTVVAVGDNYFGQCDVSGWKDIVAISAGAHHTVGLKSDGTVVAVGLNEDGQCDVSGWKDIVAISAGGHHTVGLQSDGTVVAAGYNDDSWCNESDWSDIKLPN